MERTGHDNRRQEDRDRFGDSGLQRRVEIGSFTPAMSEIRAAQPAEQLTTTGAEISSWFVFTPVTLPPRPLPLAMPAPPSLGLVAAGEGVAVVPAGVRSFRPADLRCLVFEEPGASTNLFLFSTLDEQSPLVRQVTTLAAELFS